MYPPSSSSSHNNNNNNSNTQRRTFRGRGGATDRHNLPQFNAARRRRFERHHNTNESNATPPDDTNHNVPHYDDPFDHNDVEDILELYPLEIIDPFVPVVVQVDDSTCVTNGVDMNTVDANRTLTHHNDNTNNDISHSLPQHIEPDDYHEAVVDTTIIQLLQKEVQHLTRRIQQLRQNWSRSKTGLIIVTTYQTNVIQASLNIIMKEWKSILQKYYRSCTNVKDEFHHLPPPSPSPTTTTTVPEIESLFRSTSHEIFVLIQHSVQCGPLSGSRPGYFKRCGSHVAEMVYQYLHTILPVSIIIANTTLVHHHDSNRTGKNIEVCRHGNDHDDDDDNDDSSDDIWKKAAALNDNDDDDEEEEDVDDDDAGTTKDDDNDHTTTLHTHQRRQQQQQQQQNEIHQYKEQHEELPNKPMNDNNTPTVTCYFTNAQLKTLQAWKKNAYQAAMIIDKTNTGIRSSDSNDHAINPSVPITILPSKSMMHQECQAQQIQKEKKRIKAMKGRR